VSIDKVENDDIFSQFLICIIRYYKMNSNPKFRLLHKR